MKINLLVCMTPLQALIAEKIIKHDPYNQYDLIYITYYNEEKNKFYYNRLSKFVRRSDFLYLKKSFFDFLYKSYVLLKRYDGQYEDLYLATIHDKYCHLLASKVNYKNLKTYDDGFGNIYPNSPFYQESYRSFLKSIIFSILGIGYNMELIKNKSLEHITIYKGMSNIIKNTKYIQLFDVASTDFGASGRRSVSIFLGQPLRERNRIYNDKFVENIVSNLNVDYYAPHPAEDYTISNDIEVIRSNLIFEDFIIKKIENNEFSEVIVYSYFSTTLFNLKNHNKIKVVSVYNSSLRRDYPEIYNFIEKCGIETLEVT